MRMFDCCLFEGMLSDVVMDSCKCVVLLLEKMMLFSVLKSILLVICVFSACIWCPMSWLWGFGEVCFSVPLSNDAMYF